jgi:hypothetical protein
MAPGVSRAVSFAVVSQLPRVSTCALDFHVEHVLFLKFDFHVTLSDFHVDVQVFVLSSWVLDVRDKYTVMLLRRVSLCIF